MKKLFCRLIVYLYLFVSVASADVIKVIDAPVSGGTCDTLQEDVSGIAGGEQITFNASSNTWMGTGFVADATYTVCSITLILAEVGDLSGSSDTLTACIYTNSCSTCDRTDDEPGTLVGSCSNAVNMSTVDDGGVATEYSFPNVSASVTSSNIYWVVPYASGINITNYPSWLSDNTLVVEPESIWKSADGSTWSLHNGTRSGSFKLYE